MLKDFRSHVETVLELDRYNFVRGPNGCGKSSIRMALEYLFTGRCKVTDAAGRGAEALIRAGAKELEVSATLESGETICRRRVRRSHIVEINGNRVPADAAEAHLRERFGSADALSAVLNAGRFIEMSAAGQKRLLARVVEAARIGIPGEISDALRALNEEPPKLASAGDVEAAYERFYELRAEAGRTLEALGKTSLETRISLLDRLTEFFGPDGAMMGQLSGRMGSFTEGLSRHLVVFGYTCTVALEPFQIFVSSSKDGHIGLSLKRLSESEQFLFGVAFQIALAIVTGLRFIVIDGANVLDKERRKMLTGLLVNSALDQAIVLATSEEARPSIVPDGVKFLDLAKA